MTLTSTLRHIPLFAHLRDADLERIQGFARERSYPKNNVIVFEEDPGDSLYVVLTGQVKVVLIGEDGREVILSTPSNGDFFGEMSLIDDEPRSAHVIAMEDSQLLVLRREDFHQCLAAMPGIAIGLLRAMCKRLRQADDKIGGLVLLDVPGRVARLLLEMADESDGIHVTKRVTHHHIAQMIGSSRETVSRTMRSLVDQDLIDVTRSKITLQNREALETAAGRDTMGPAQRVHYQGPDRRGPDGNR